MAAPDLEQMNKLRRSLGLPLLNVSGQPPPAAEGPTFKEDSASDDSDEEPASTLETREAAGYENWKQLREEDKRRLEREQRKKQIQKARDAAARLAKLEGQGLGDEDGEGDLDDTKAWLKGQKKRQAKIEKERAERLAAELAERERLAAVEYTAKDLAGVQVAHEIGDFENGESEQILTLQDREIGREDASDEEDVLESADMVARDKLKERLDAKKRKAYDVNDDSEKALLSQYDEKKRKAFTLDAQGAGGDEREAKRQQIGERLKNTISLDILQPEPVSDYMEIKMKKAKKAKKNIRQKMAQDEDDIFPPVVTTTTIRDRDVMQLDGPGPSKPRAVENVFNDDEELAKALSLSRKAALKKQKRRVEDIVKQLKEEEADVQLSSGGGGDGGLVLDDTTVFLDNLSSRPRDEAPAAVRPSIEKAEQAGSPADTDGDAPMGEAYTITEDEEELLDRLRREQSTHTPEITHSGLDEEATLDQGLGATLNLLKQRGLVKSSDAGDKNTLYKDRQRFIIEARLREHENEQKARTQRERDRQSGKLVGLSMKEREEHARWQNTQREHQSSIQAAAAFNREYKPDVQIKYVDDTGRLMNQKEAFKHLSHQFHGKGSGKHKTEKHLKKIAEEKRREAASILDSSQATGLNNATGVSAKKNKEAGVRLA